VRVTQRLARRLVEPDFWTCPHGLRQRPAKVLTFGPEVAEVCAAAGFAPDPQQELGLDLIFAIKPDGSPASFSFCVICCRQNLKTGLFKQAVIGWLFVTEQRLMVWSSHEMSTTTEAQRDLEELLLDSPALRKRMLPQKNNGVYYDNGSERIELATGQRVLFKARRDTGGRGLAAPKVILDEAFALKAAMMGSLLPLMMAQQDPQVLYGSSAGKADSAVLFDIRERGRNAMSPEMTYLEWLSDREPCADPDCRHPKDAEARGLDCALDRERLIRKANPTISTGRIDIGTVRNLRQELPAEEFMRECLGWWDEPDDLGPPAVDLRRWGAEDACKPQAAAPSRATVVVDVEPDRSLATVGLAGNGPGGRVLLMVHTCPVDKAVETVQALQANIDVLEVALHPTSQAGALLPEFAAADIDIHKLTSTDLGQGWSAFQTGVIAGRFVHLGQVELDAAVSVARSRKMPNSEAQLVDRKTVHVPLGPVVAASVAAQRWATLTAKPPIPPQPPRLAPRRPKAGSVATAGF
jgi:hypothetical protein